MRLITADRRRIAQTPTENVNTEIGGISSVVTTRQELASLLQIQESSISYFEISGPDIKAKIETTYTIPDNCFNNSGLSGDWGGGAILTKFIDKEGKVTIGGRAAFIKQTNLIDIDFPGMTYMDQQCLNETGIGQAILPELTDMYWYQNFRYCTKLKLVHAPKLNLSSGGAVNRTFGPSAAVYIPTCTNIGNTTDTDETIFADSPSGVEIWADPSMETINSGGEEADLAWARANKSAVITYGTNNDLLSKPDEVTDLSSSEVYATSIKLDFTTPPSVNAISKYEVWNNDEFLVNIVDQDNRIISLNPETTYHIRIKTVDIYGNKSEFSNQETVATTALQVYADDLLIEYKLEGTTGDVTDTQGNHHGTLIDTVTRGVSGKVNNAFDFSDGEIRIPDHVDLRLNDGTSNKNVSFSMWFSIDTIAQRHVLINRRNTPNEHYFYYHEGKQILGYIWFTDGSNMYIQIPMSDITAGRMYLFSVVIDSVNGKFYGLLDGKIISETSFDPSLTMVTATTNDLVLGRGGWDKYAPFDGKIDEFRYWVGPNAPKPGYFSDEYNNGNGITS